jgi:ABC-type glycerol-3-phosphate transport system permease component
MATLPVSGRATPDFLRGIPKELEEAAKIDGPGWLCSTWSMITPLVVPVMVFQRRFNAGVTAGGVTG